VKASRFGPQPQPKTRASDVARAAYAAPEEWAGPSPPAKEEGEEEDVLDLAPEYQTLRGSTAIKYLQIEPENANQAVPARIEL